MTVALTKLFRSQNSISTAEKELCELKAATSNKNNRGNTEGGKTTHISRNKAVVYNSADGSYHAVNHVNQGNKDSNKDGNHGKKHSYHYDNFPYYATVEAVDKDYSGIAYNSPTPVLSNNQFWV